MDQQFVLVDQFTTAMASIQETLTNLRQKMDVSRRELEALRQRLYESISSLISHWWGKIAEIVDRPLERDQIQMLLRSPQPMIDRHVVGIPSTDFGSLVSALYDVEDVIPPAGDLHFMDFIKLDDCIYMLSWDDSKPKLIVVDESYEPVLEISHSDNDLFLTGFTFDEIRTVELSDGAPNTSTSMLVIPLSLNRMSLLTLYFPEETDEYGTSVEIANMIDGVIPCDEYSDEMFVVYISQIIDDVQLNNVSLLDLFGISDIDDEIIQHNSDEDSSSAFDSSPNDERVSPTTTDVEIADFDLNKANPKDNFLVPYIDILVDSTAGYLMLSFMDGFSRLRLNPKKCTFGVTSGKLPGYMVSERGIEADPDKIRAIFDMLVQRTEREIRGFLDIALGCMLAQLDDSRKEQAIYYSSKRMLDYEIRYVMIECFCLALVWATRRLRHYTMEYSVHLISRLNYLRYLLDKPALKSIKESIITDHLASLPVLDDRAINDDFPDEDIAAVTSLSSWRMYFDGATKDENISNHGYIAKLDDGLPWYHDIYWFFRFDTYPKVATTKDKRALRQLATCLLDERKLRATYHVHAYQRKMARAFKKWVKPRLLQRGDLVLKVIRGMIKDPRGMFRPNWSGPYFIRELTLEDAAWLMDLDGNQFLEPTNVNQLKKYYV
uniref:Reverse transcriptase RNase H-like domain-containing protein n=1 Tax=Vitis vinifera TaxID=29760 RepID=A5AVG6_VITVI|nr:hypothetical protein VITISV_041842 [Vitis vinifera]